MPSRKPTTRPSVTAEELVSPGIPRHPVVRGRPRFLPVWVAVGDLILIHGGFILAFALRFQGTFPEANLEAYRQSALGLSLLALALFMGYGLYEFRPQSWRTMASGVLVAVTLFPVFGTGLSFLLRALAFPRTVILLAWVMHILLLLPWRALVWRYLHTHGGQRAVVVGPEGESQDFAYRIRGGRNGRYRVVGVVTTSAQDDTAAGDREAAPTRDPGAGPQRDDAPLAAPGEPLPVLNGLHALGELAIPPDFLIITPSTPATERSQAIIAGGRMGVRVLVIPNCPDLLALDARTEPVGPTLAFEIEPGGVPAHLAWAKRMLDIGCALIGLGLTLPLYPPLALAVKLSSPGPVFYRQTRVGQGGMPYVLLKFRTMRQDAESATGATLSRPGDPRVTGVGRLLRRFRIDELPQLFNVLSGTMSLVGPRPERPEFVAKYNRTIPYYDHRHVIKPGLTGLAQLYARYDSPVAEKLRYDLLYIKRYSLLLDLRILLLTGKVVLTGEEAHWGEREPL